MDKLTANIYKPYILVTWLLVSFSIISLLLFPLAIVQIITLGLVIAIQYRARSLSKITLGIITVVYVLISMLCLYSI
jgi:hypothetical protein